MAKLTYAAVLLVLASTAASAQGQRESATRQNEPTARVLTSIPQKSETVTNWYKQNVYDPSDNKIGDIKDVLVSQDGKIDALIVAVGGFVGAGEKDVAVPFNAVRATNKNNKNYLVMNASKDELKNAKGFKYDRNSLTWIPEESSGTTGKGPAPGSNAR
jgi:sporulation protein YlmC with PRC-barrel domain